MYYVVQENTFREEHHYKLIKALERFKLDYEIVKVRPFIDTFDYKTDRKDVFVFGALKLAEMAKKLDWNPGAIVGPNHDYMVYKDYYKENLLNYDSTIYRFADEVNFTSPYMFFRPCLDSKTFVGKTYSREDWIEFRDAQLLSKYMKNLNEDTLMQVASPKFIYNESRCWVVNGKVVTWSQYRFNNRNVLSYDVSPDALDFAQRMVDIYQLDKSFVIDVCLTEDGYKIVECGSISCAGFYKSDLQRTISALEDCYN